ncbi:Holliday junction branch migration protein RuvA [Collinsella ihumii]|uniref:Holliday junction branch migration protein RuvA n=1 Tax=Collinsella ihumii TaxID=1720204 RepID=UPI00082D8BB2|nr:Holliday junction branch migration protein RuvA [Collinsella ihumii]MBM6906238.1 Holliday junction branch migration protein RuvA [Collinsella tanakaei]
MITQIRGTLIEATPSAAVVDVGGVGFELGVSGTTAASLPAPGEECRLFTRLQVREDAMTLFGFATKEERTMFERLVSVSKVGPRLALAVLSKFTVSQLYSVVMAEDDQGMATVPGVGKKTAQRLILELKSVFAKDHGLLAADIPAAGQLPLAPAPAPSAIDDARAALLSMGFSPQEVDLALSGYDGDGMRVEDLLTAALKRLGMDA